MPLLHYMVVVHRGLSFLRAKKLLAVEAQANDGRKLLPREGFYVNKVNVSGCNFKSMVILMQRPQPTWALNHTPIYRVFRPAIGLSKDVGFDLFMGRGVPRWTKITPEQAQRGWTQVYEQGHRSCAHGPNCRNQRECVMIGRSLQDYHLLSGAVLPFWDKIKVHLTSKGGKPTSKGSYQDVKKM